MELLFDRKTMRRRHARARGKAADDLAQYFSREVAERLNPIAREFKTTLVCGPFATVAPKSAIVQNTTVIFDEDALPFAPATFDCIISAGSLQGVNDLPGALLQFRQALKPDGLLLAALFAGQTLTELRRAWLAAEADRRDGASPRVAPMAELRDLGGLLQRAGFALPVADLDRTTLRYDSTLALMREIKTAGYGNALAARSRRPVTGGLLAAIAEHYPVDADGRISATIEIAWLTAWAPDESQPKPLKPGSAKARLANALGVAEKPLPRE